jgi:hypothetical protein
MRYRRLARDDERTTANAEAMIYRATVIIMTRRLTRYENGQPQIKRWGGERTLPAQRTALSTGSQSAKVSRMWLTSSRFRCRSCDMLLIILILMSEDCR